MRSCSCCQTTYPDNVAFCPRDGTALLDLNTWSEGTLIRGRYRLLSKVGQGGMGAVYKALHVTFDELRALKVMNPDLVRDQVFVRRFKQEAVLARKLQHPHAVRVDDIDEAEDGRPFIVMEFIEGQSLKSLIASAGTLPVERVCAIVKQVASALQAAHTLGIVHRDIKPANIVLVSSAQGESAKVLDFGIAKLKEAQATETLAFTLTGAGMVIGTPEYMSPEQSLGKRGNELDGRSDLYSLGIVMYQMLSGNLPFKGETTMQMLFAHIHTPPKPIQEVRADLPGPVARLVMKCLEKNPEMRPPAAQALIQEIEQAEVEIARSRIKQEQLEREQAEKERLARDRSELERQAREKAEAERLAKEKARQEQLARERAEAERRMAERAEAERAARQAQLEELRQEYAEKERRLKEKAEAEQHEREKAQAARLAMMMAQAKHLEEETQTLPAEIQNQAPASHLEAGPTAFRKAAWLVVAAIVCIAIGLGAWYVHRRGQKTSLQQASNTTLASGVVAPPSSPPAAQTSSPAPAGSSGSPSAEGNGTHPTLPPSTANTEPAGSEAPTGAAPVEPQVDQQKIESIIDSGNRYFRQRQYAKAVRQYQAGLKLDPANLALLHLLKEARAAAKLHQPGTTSQTAADTQPSPPSSTPPPVAPSVGSVRIATAPGSQVFIDGSEAGITGADGTLLVPQLSPGKHQVHLTHTGDLGWYGYAFVQPGQTAVSQVTLKASTTVAPPSPKPRASPAVVSFHVVHQHTFGSCSGTLTVGNGRIRYVASKKSHSFDASVASIRQYGTVRYGADFYFQLQDGKQYLFSGPLTALQAFQQARGAVALPAGDGSASLHN